MLSVTHISTRDISGGAARACHRLHSGLQQDEVESMMFVRMKQSTQRSVVHFRPKASLFAYLRRLRRYARIQVDSAPYYMSRPKHRELFSDDRTRFRGEVTDQLPSSDILHLHWRAGFVDIRSFFRRTTAPVVWTLHDMNAFTGGCHYDVGCGRYTQGCGRCPQLGSHQEEDLSRAIWRRKWAVYKEAIRKNRLYIVTPSKWLAKETQRSKLLESAPVRVIPYGINKTIFFSRDTKREEKELNINEKDRVILFVAGSTSNYRKGFGLLCDAISGIQKERITLLSVGEGKGSIADEIKHIHFGKVESDKKMSKIYSMADVFVIPSRQDNLPNTVLESMACGTPVVGFNTGGIPDMVRPNETGWLAERGSVRSLRDAIETALSTQADRLRKANRCREVVEEEYTLDQQARKYKELYQTALKKIE